MKKILVPTDFSEHAEYALKVAAQIAKENDGEIFLTHMLEFPSQMVDAVNAGASIPEIMFFMKKAQEKLEDLASRPYLEGIKVSEAVKYEKAFDGILKASQSNEVDLVIMGSHGLSGFKELFVGSTTEKVVRLSQAPVLVIKEPTLPFVSKRMVFASDFSDEIKATFPKVVSFAKKLGAHLDLVIVNTPNTFKTTLEAEQVMNDFIANFEAVDFSLHIYNDINIETGVINFSNSIGANIIAMCTHGRGGLYHFFNGSVSEALVNHAKLPVITFKL